MPITLKSTGGGSITLTTPSTASDYTLTFPAQNGTPITTQPSTAGNVLTSDGTNWVSQAPAATGVPTGGIVYYPSASAPSGYLRCDGSIYNRSAYSSLATVIGTPTLLSAETLRNSNFSTGTLTNSWNYMTSANNLAFMPGSVWSPSAQNANGIRTSSDGITFTARNAVSFYPTPNQVAYINGTYIAPQGQAQIPNGATVTNYQTSTDGATWTSRNFAVTSGRGGIRWIVGNSTLGRALMWTNSSYNCCGTYTYFNADAALYYSTDGTTWTLAASPPTNSGFTFTPAAGNNGFVAIGATLTGLNSWSYYLSVWYSTDGSTWTNITSNLQSINSAATSFSRVLWDGTYYYIYAANSIVFRSTTGASGSWTQIAYPQGSVPSFGDSNFAYLRDGLGNYYASLQNQTYYSNDMSNWAVASTIGSYRAICGNTLVGQNGLATPSTYTTNGSGYTTATQFPVPNLTTPNIGTTAAPPPVAYIKT